MLTIFAASNILQRNFMDRNFMQKAAAYLCRTGFCVRKYAPGRTNETKAYAYYLTYEIQEYNRMSRLYRSDDQNTFVEDPKKKIRCNVQNEDALMVNELLFTLHTDKFVRDRYALELIHRLYRYGTVG
ncbi:hypothetical protein Plhal304r1_c040g0117621 [Plasmopara halstedii]